MRLYSWNVNGIRAAAGKGLESWLQETQPDVLCLQETRADGDSLPDGLRNLGGYHGYWAPLRQKGYAGVATFCRQPADTWRAGLGSADFDDEARVVITEIGDVSLYNVYFPNGRANPARLAYKLAFYAAFLDHIDADVQSGRCVIFCGDVNTAHTPIDIARPKENAKRSGFLPEERAWLDCCVQHGWVDTFRHLHPDADAAPTPGGTHARAPGAATSAGAWTTASFTSATCRASGAPASPPTWPARIIARSGSSWRIDASPWRPFTDHPCRGVVMRYEEVVAYEDEDLAALPQRLAPFAIPHQHPRVDTRLVPDVWFVPATVLEVAGAEPTLSPVHTAGWEAVRPGSGSAIRFPCFTGRWRDDKAPEDATTTDELLELFRAQGRKIGQ